MKIIVTDLEKLRMVKMDVITIKRAYMPNCTIGFGSFKGFDFFVLELPWKDNTKNISCIPPGNYDAIKRISPGKGYEVIEFINVPNRTYIQAHYGNFTRQILGCQLYGDSLKFVDGDSIIDVTNSEETIKKLLSMLPDVFEIKII